MFGIKGGVDTASAFTENLGVIGVWALYVVVVVAVPMTGCTTGVDAPAPHIVCVTAGVVPPMIDEACA